MTLHISYFSSSSCGSGMPSTSAPAQSLLTVNLSSWLLLLFLLPTMVSDLIFHLQNRFVKFNVLCLALLYIIIIMFAILGRGFWLLVFLMVVFGWMSLVGVVRAEFLWVRNFEYVRAAKALGVSDRVIMFRHMLPNAMVATLTFLPFIFTGAIGTLAGLDLLGFGLPSSLPSLGEMAQQAKQNLQAPWLAWTAFVTYAVMLSLLVFIFEGVRDAFDPRKTFS